MPAGHGAAEVGCRGFWSRPLSRTQPQESLLPVQALSGSTPDRPAATRQLLFTSQGRRTRECVSGIDHRP